MYADRIHAGKKRSIQERLYGDSTDGKRQCQTEARSGYAAYKNEERQISSKVDAGNPPLNLQIKGPQQAYQGGKDPGAGYLREKPSGTRHPPPANNDLSKPKPVPERNTLVQKNVASLRATVPSLRATVPSSKPTVSEATVPSSRATVPSSKSTVPSSKAIVPSSRAMVPSSKSTVPSSKATVPDAQKLVAPISHTPSQQKPELSVDNFLQSLGLEKYLLTFQVEEVDMTALLHMTENDLKALGLPMGPRKKIVLALNSRE